MKFNMPFYACDSWMKSDLILDVHCAHNAKKVGSVYCAQSNQVDAIVQTATNSFKQYKSTPHYKIIEFLKQLHDLVQSNRLDLAKCISLEASKPYHMASAEVERGLRIIESGIAECGRKEGFVIPTDIEPKGEGKLCIQESFPIGVCLGITAFNFPLHLILHKLIPAVIAKNTIIIKPALQTPLIALKLAELISQTSLPQGVVQIVPCHNEIAEEFVKHDDIACISFTGSSNVGWKIKEMAPKKKVLLE